MGRRRAGQGRNVPARTRSATSRILVRSLIAVRWMNVNASCSLQPALVDQDALGPVDQLARLQLLAERVDLAAQALQLAEPADRDLDRGDQIALLERLDEVRQRAGVAGLLDDLALAERGEHQHAADPLGGDRPRRVEAVHARHLDVEDGQVRAEAADELDRLVAPAGLADDLVALLLEGLAQVEADDGFVLGDHHTDGHEWCPFTSACAIQHSGMHRCASDRS